MRIGQAKVDFDGLVIESPAGHHAVESKVMRVLEVLVQHSGQVVTRGDLIDSVWGVGHGGDERLSRAISLLRKALGDPRGENVYIKTIPRRGYKLVADVEVFEIAPKSAATISLRNEPEIPSPAQKSNPIQKTIEQITPEGKPRPKTFKISPAMGVLAAILLAFIVWAGPMGGLGKTTDNLKVDDGLELIQNYTAENAISEAQELFSNILAKNPDHAAARAGLALSLIREYTHLERDPALLRRAKSYAESALRADDHLALANIAVGWVAEFEGDYEKALKSYDRADILGPDNALTLEGQIRTLNKQGKREDVRQLLDRAISIFPENPSFRSYYGQFFTSENSYRNAEEMFRILISLSPENPRAYAQLAQTLHLQDKTTEGIKILQDGLKIRESALLYNNLGTYLYFQGQYEMSAQAFEKTVEIDGDTHDYLYWANLADVYRQIPSRKDKANENYDKAIRLLDEEILKNPEITNLRSRSALYNAKRGNYTNARQELTKVPLNDQSPAIELYRAVVTYEILSERSLALQILDKALQAGYPLIEILNDPELDKLRQDSEYQTLITTKGQNQ